MNAPAGSGIELAPLCVKRGVGAITFFFLGRSGSPSPASIALSQDLAVVRARAPRVEKYLNERGNVIPRRPR